MSGGFNHVAEMLAFLNQRKKKGKKKRVKILIYYKLLRISLSHNYIENNGGVTD